MVEKNAALEAKVLILEDRVAVSENVSSKLSSELDRLDQYHRRSNIIIKDAFLPEKETIEEVKNTVVEIISQDLKLPEMAKSIDKLHRIGKVLTKNGKKQQDIIVRFKTHHSRYSIYKEWKMAKNVRISPYLTKKRVGILKEASSLVEKLDMVDFVFANIHGDLNLRLVEPFHEKQYFQFSTVDELTTLLNSMDIYSE